MLLMKETLFWEVNKRRTERKGSRERVEWKHLQM